MRAIRSMRRWAAACLAACAALHAAQAADFDTSAGNLIAVLRESPGTNHAQETLLPIGRVQARLSDGREVEIDASWFHLVGDMHVRLVFDGGQQLQTASPDDLQRLHFTPEEALARAVDNLRTRYGAPRAQPWSGGLMQVTAGADDLVSSYFLDRTFWTEQARAHPGGVVVSVPVRGRVLFAPADDDTALLNLRFTAAALFASNERSRVSSALYLFKDGRWSVMQPPQRLARAGD